MFICCYWTWRRKIITRNKYLKRRSNVEPQKYIEKCAVYCVFMIKTLHQLRMISSENRDFSSVENEGLSNCQSGLLKFTLSPTNYPLSHLSWLNIHFSREPRQENHHLELIMKVYKHQKKVFFAFSCNINIKRKKKKHHVAHFFKRFSMTFSWFLRSVWVRTKIFMALKT